jgi:CRISPR-associated protein Cmr6
MIPIPNRQKELLEHPNANFSLLFPRLTEWQEKSGKWTSEGAIEKLQNKFKCNASILEKIHINQRKIPNICEIKAKLTQPFVSGLGSGHPTETGFILDRNSGLPYIPASSIKGVLHSVCEPNLADELFGNGNNQGKVIILDAFPVDTVQLELDIMNPHDKDETKNPIPIKFLTVKKGTVFAFRIVQQNCNIEEIFQKAFERGFGAKTNIGYGKFTTDIKKETSPLKNETQKQQNSLKIGQKYQAILQEKPKKSWKAKIGNDNITILNSDEVPQDKKAGDTVNVTLKSLPNGSNAGNANYCA